MPSKSPEQAKLMRAVAHGWHKPGGGGPSVAVAKDFVKADKAQSFENGGLVMSNKGYSGKSETFAKGGDVLGRTKDFMKAPDRFRQQDLNGKFIPANAPMVTSDDWGKGDKSPPGAIMAPPERKSKVLPCPKPHS